MCLSALCFFLSVYLQCSMIPMFQPMYGGKMHRVTGDIKDNMTGKCLYKIDGEWNGKLKFTDESNVS